MPINRFFAIVAVVVCILAGCSKTRNSEPAASAADGPAVAADLRVIDPAETIDPTFAPTDMHKIGNAALEKHGIAAKPPEVTRLEFSADGRRLLVGSWQATNGVQVWTVGGGPAIRVREWRSDWGLLSPDGRQIALVLAGQPEAAIIDVDSGNPVTKLGYTSVRDFSFSSPELLVQVWSNSANRVQGRTTLMTFDGKTGAKRSEVVLRESQSLMHRSSGLFADRKQVAVAHGNEDVIDLWDVTTGQRVRQVPAVGPKPNLDWQELFASSDGSQFAASREKHLVFWDGTTGSVVADLSDQPIVTVGTFVPGRDVFVFRPSKPVRSDAANDVAAFDVRSQTYVAVFAGLPAAVTAVAASPDGKWLATGDKSGRVRLWDLGRLP